MKLKRIISEDDAVSPVIGVILMVAITVILAAVIASFVLGLGGDVETTPTASFSFDYNQSGDIVDITHDGGDSIKAQELYVRGDGFEKAGDADADKSNIDLDKQSAKKDNPWGDISGASVSGEVGDSSAVVAGDSLTAAVTASYDIRVAWESKTGDSSATLGRDTGPDA